MPPKIPPKNIPRNCDEEKIPCLDLLPEFRKEREKEFFRDNDDHFNEAGFRLAEKLTSEFFKHGS